MGYVAGRITTTRVVGALSGVEVPPVMRYGNGFQQGVYASCPNCKVLISYIGSFTDGDRGMYLAEQQKLLGADVMCSLAGYSGVRVYHSFYFSFADAPCRWLEWFPLQIPHT